MALPLRLVHVVRALPLLLVLGCAEELRVPDPPVGEPCETLDDCAPSDRPVCGSLRACVDGICEATPTLYRPCP